MNPFRTLKPWALSIGGAVSALAGMLAVQLLAPRLLGDPAARTTAAILALAFAAPFVAAAWRLTDAADRQAEIKAWFHGGIAAGLAGLIVLGAFASVELRHAAESGLRSAAAIIPPHGPSLDAFRGALAMLIFQALGFFAVRAAGLIGRR